MEEARGWTYPSAMTKRKRKEKKKQKNKEGRPQLRLNF